MSGTLIGGVVGAVIGFFAGGGIQGAVYGFQIGAFAGAVLMPGKLPGYEGPRLEDLKVQTSTYGVGIPILYGRGRMSGNIIWTTDLVEHSNTQESGGKGGPSQSSTTYTYTVSTAIGLCEGPITGIRRVWADSTLIYDASATNTGDRSYLGADLGMKVYTGSETQLPDPTIEAHLGAGNVPAYRGLAYVVFTDFQLEKFGNRIPIFSFEIVGVGTSTYALSIFQNVANQTSRMVFNPLLNEYWVSTSQSVGTDPFITRINADNGQIAGTISTGATVALDAPMIYDDFDKAIWAYQISTNTLYKFDAATAILVFAATQSGMTGIYLSGQDGSFWVKNTTSLKKINKTDGSTIASYSVGFTIYDMAFPADGGIWMTKSGSADLYRFDPFSGGVALKYSAGGTLTNIAYDASRDDLWIVRGGDHVIEFDPDTAAEVNSFILAATPSGAAGSFVYDSFRDLLWSSSTIGSIVAANNASDGSAGPSLPLGSTESIPSTPNPYPGYYTETLYNVGGVDGLPVAPFKAAYLAAVQANFPAYGVTGPAEIYAEGLYTYIRVFSPSFTLGYLRSVVVRRGTAVAPGGNTCPDPSWTLSGDGLTCTRLVGGTPGVVVTTSAGVSTPSAGTTLKWVFDRVTPGVITLADILTDISERTARLTAADINVAQQTSTIVDGYVITRQATARSCIEQLQLAYFFDEVESDNVVKFVNRGSASILTVPDSDLAAFKAFDTATPDDLSTTRLQETELPRELNVIYQALNSDFQTGTQQSRRLVGATGDAQSFQLPLALPDDKAKQIADTAMFTIWTARTQYQFVTTNKYAKYEPTDVVTVKGRTLRLTKRDEQDGVITWQGVEEEPTVYSQTAFGVPTNFSPQSIKTIGATDLVLLDIPLLRDVDNDAGAYVAGCGFLGTWPGAVLYKSGDGGASYAEVTSLATAATIGRAKSVLAASSVGNVFDQTNTVTVSLLNGGTVSSTTQLAVLNGANAAIIGSEIIQFTTATLNGDGTYTLSGLLRGRKGTEWAESAHVVGEPFVLLTTASLARLPMTTAEIGLVRQYKAVTFGGNLQSTNAQAFTDTAVALKPLSPVQLAGSRDGSNNLTLTWVRRSRVGAEWRDLVDVPLGEASESYDVEIWNSTYTTLKRTFAALSSPTASYTAAQQTTDFGTTQSTVYVRVYQNSAVVGRGFKLEGTA